MCSILKRKNKIKDGVYSVDRTEENNVVLQNIETGDILNTQLNFDVSDGDVLIFKDKQFVKDNHTQEAREKLILEKFNKVKRREE